MTNAQGDRGDLLHWLMASLGQDFRDDSYVGLYQKFEAFLVDQHRLGRRTVVIVDEAQNLGAKSLEELRMMSNLNTAQQELLQIILVGQPQLKTLLSKPELVQFAQRVGSDFHLVPLQHDDVTPYIDHRLAVAGADRTLFTEEACELVAHATGGTPRLINVLCDTSLMYGFGSGAEFISSADRPVRHRRQAHPRRVRTGSGISKSCGLGDWSSRSGGPEGHHHRTELGNEIPERVARAIEPEFLSTEGAQAEAEPVSDTRLDHGRSPDQCSMKY